MSGNLDNSILGIVRQRFEKKCISLLTKAYSTAIVTTRDFSNFNENDITAQLVGFMKKDPSRKNYKISLVREAPVDTMEVLDGLASADQSARIDIKFATWSSNKEYEYHMEAKNLAEISWTKLPENILVKAAPLHHRYINTGIDNFISGRYPAGCLLGYVLQGKPNEIVNKINNLLTTANRQSEHLQIQSFAECDYCFVSKHANTASRTLKHFLLKFA